MEELLQDRGLHTVLHYLDDFLVLGPPGHPACGELLATTLALCEELGFPVEGNKTEGPTIVLTFLGIELDIQQQQVRLSKDKLSRLTVTTGKWVKKAGQPTAVNTSKKGKPSLLGLLHHAAMVISNGG